MEKPADHRRVNSPKSNSTGMSFRSAIRSRFRKSDTFGVESTNKETIAVPVNRPLHEKHKRSRSMEFMEDVLEVPITSEANSTDGRRGSGVPADVDTYSDNEGALSLMVGAEGSGSDREFLELQNKELQMQLLSATITNQNLMEEVKSFKERRKVEKLERELKEERQRYEKLLRKFKEIKSSDKGSIGLKLHRPKNPFSRVKAREGDSESLDSESGVSGPQATASPRDVEVDIVLSSSTESLVAANNTVETALPASSPNHTPLAPDECGRCRSWWNYSVEGYRRFLDDFRTVDEFTEASEDPDGEPLSPRRLKDNIARFTRAFHPISSAISGLKQLVAWKSPTYTALVFSMFVYAVWTNWSIPLLLALALSRLTLNYFKYRRRWAVNIHFLSEYELLEATEKDSRVTTQISFVVHVARKCQNIAGDFADVLEKLNNLLTWQCPEYTSQLTKLLIFLLILSILLTTEMLIFTLGVYLLGKLFLVDYIFMRFPRIRRKYDQFYQLWLALPTDGQYNSYTAGKEVGKYILTSADDRDLAFLCSLDSGSVSADSKVFCGIFNLPHSESPLSSWKNGKRCILLNKEKTITNVFKHGKLYLTRSFLCFERQKDKERKSRNHVVIPLRQITKVEKTKPFSWMPNVGMAIEISILGLDKPLLFGFVLSRDEIFEGLMQAARQAKLPWSSTSEKDKDRSSEKDKEKEKDKDRDKDKDKDRERSVSGTGSTSVAASTSRDQPSTAPMTNGGASSSTLDRRLEVDDQLIGNIYTALLEDTDSE